MADIDWGRIKREKDLHRTHLATLPPAEKMRIVERLRDEGLAMKADKASPSRETMGHVHVNVSGAMGHVHLNVLGADVTHLSTAMTRNISTATLTNLCDRKR